MERKVLRRMLEKYHENLFKRNVDDCMLILKGTIKKKLFLLLISLVGGLTKE